MSCVDAQAFRIGPQAHAFVDVVLECGEPARVQRRRSTCWRGSRRRTPRACRRGSRCSRRTPRSPRASPRVVGAGPGASRVAEARHRGNRIVELRRQLRGKPFADQDDRLAPLAQAAQPDRQRPQRRHRHLIADLFDRRGRIVGVLLLELVTRLVVELTSFEVLYRLDNRRVVARQREVRHRQQRIHDADEVPRGDLLLDELHERAFDAHAGAAPDVIVVQEDREDAHVGPCRFALFVLSGPHLRELSAQRGSRLIDLDELNVSTCLTLVVLEDLEVFRCQVDHGIALLVGDDDVDADEVDAAPDDLTRGFRVRPDRRRRLLRRRLRGRRRGLRRRRRLRSRAETIPAATSARRVETAFAHPYAL